MSSAMAQDQQHSNSRFSDSSAYTFFSLQPCHNFLVLGNTRAHHEGSILSREVIKNSQKCFAHQTLRKDVRAV